MKFLIQEPNCCAVEHSWCSHININLSSSKYSSTAVCRQRFTDTLSLWKQCTIKAVSTAVVSWSLCVRLSIRHSSPDAPPNLDAHADLEVRWTISVPGAGMWMNNISTPLSARPDTIQREQSMLGKSSAETESVLYKSLKEPAQMTGLQ